MRNFHNDCTSLYSHQQCRRGPFIPYLHQHLLSLVPFAITILTDIRWYVIVVLVCISLMISDVEHPFKDLLAIFMSLGKCLVRFLYPFLVLSFCLFAIELPEFLIFFVCVNPLLSMWFTRIFSCSIGCLLILLIISFIVQKLFSLMESHVFMFAFVAFAFCVKSKK